MAKMYCGRGANRTRSGNNTKDKAKNYKEQNTSIAAVTNIGWLLPNRDYIKNCNALNH